MSESEIKEEEKLESSLRKSDSNLKTALRSGIKTEYKKNDTITDDFIIKQIDERKTYLEILLKKNDSEVKAILKDNIDLFRRTYKVNDHVICKARVRKRKDDVLLELAYIKKYDLDPTEEFEQKIDGKHYIKKFDELRKNIKDQDYKSLLDEFFQDQNIRTMFFVTPAARRNHHNYEFGLLQHTVEVCEVALFIGNYFGNVNLDLLVTGCLLHDIGKIKCYDFEKNQIIKTDWEHLLGHLSISAIFTSKMMPENFDSKKAMMIYHLILSHHGKPSFGSPVPVKMKEAKILSYADSISSTINHIDNLEYINNWTKNDLFGSSWYKES